MVCVAVINIMSGVASSCVRCADVVIAAATAAVFSVIAVFVMLVAC